MMLIERDVKKNYTKITKLGRLLHDQSKHKEQLDVVVYNHKLVRP